MPHLPHNACDDPLHISVPIIGFHRTPLVQKFGIPRQPNLVNVHSVIELLPPFDTKDAFEGIADFSHLWITWYAHHNYSTNEVNQKNASNDPQSHTTPTPFKAKVRPPRLGGNQKVGVFATRSTYRPSQLGLSVVQLTLVEQDADKVRLHIVGADMVEGTPIIDIKPYIAYSDAIIGAKSGFASQTPTLKPVQITVEAQKQIDNEKTLSVEDIDIICQLIAQDPRPAYRQNDVERVFVMRYKNYDVGFTMRMEDVNEGAGFKPILWIVSVTGLG